MSDTNSPKVTMASKNSLPGGASEHAAFRRWTCPDDQTIAAYVDGELPEIKKTRLELHLAKCGPCRLIVADVVKLQRSADIPAPPFDIARETSHLAPAVHARSSWIWVSVGAVAAVMLLTIGIALLHQPQTHLAVSATTPHAPIVAKAEPPISPNPPARVILRKPQIPELRPVLTFPVYDSTVVAEHLQFKWKPVSGSRYYEIIVVTSDGEPLWQAQTESSTLQLPSDTGLKDGSYFVWIVANFANGQQATSAPVRFQVKR